MVLSAGSPRAMAGGIFGAAPPMPDWVRQAAKQTLPTYPKSTKAVVLMEDTTYTVGSNGQAVEHVRRVVKILRPQGREYGYPIVYFDKDSKVLSMHVWSIDAAGHEYSLKDSEIIEIGHPGEGGELYDDAKMKVADPPGRDPGGIIAYEYEEREHPYVAEANWVFQDELPRLNQQFTLILPAGYSYNTTWANHAKLDAADLEGKGYRWGMTNVAGIDLEDVPLSPSAASLSGRMTVHYSGPGLAQPQDGTWQGVGLWYEGLSRDRMQPNADITAKAQALVAGKTDFYDQAEVLGEFVQKQIRYFVIEMGIGGDQPHFASDIYKGRYGDCKDKATLLGAMLSSVGLHSDIVLVDSQRGTVNPENPSRWGNHAIAAIEVPAGYQSPKLHSLVTTKAGKRYLIFDPTWSDTPFGQIEDNLQGSYGLIVEGKASELVQIPVVDPNFNTIRRTATFALATDGTLKGQVVDRRFGDIASTRRRELASSDGHKQQQYMDRTVSHDLAAASLTDLKFENVDALDKDLTTSFQLTAAHFATATGPLLMVRPRVFGDYAPNADRKARTVPIDMGTAMQATDSFDIELPEGYAVDELPDPIQQDFGFASYESKTVLNGRVLHYTRTYTVRQVEVPAEKYGEVQKLASVIASDEDSRAVLKRAH
ncbi:DUF3857 domain-containing transglutaminase family protein [Bryocella elongata]|nr:DUF3857 domain-containing protein [Bryocella elongata]